MEKRRNILVFGGSFSPPTLAHEAIIERCLALSNFDTVWVMPSGDRSDKQMSASDVHRLHMLNLLKATRFANNPRLVISDFELTLPRPSSTYSTLRKLRARFADTEFWFVLGGDAYRSLPTWPHGVQLQKELTKLFIVTEDVALVPRYTTFSQLSLPKNMQAISSTRVRAAIKAHEKTDELLSSSIVEYIAKHHLYGA